MNHLTRNDYAAALQLLLQVEVQAGGLESFVRAVTRALGRYVASERTALCLRDLRSGHRQVLGLRGTQAAADAVAGFDRHFFGHPQLRLQGLAKGGPMQRMSEVPSGRDVQRSALYANGYQRTGLEHAMAVPLYQDAATQVSIVVSRRGMDFGERDRARLELLRPHLAFLFCHACRRAAGLAQRAGAPMLLPAPRVDLASTALTPREREVLRWLSAGKTDADIAALLSISPRTVNKHLEHIYVKLGVETRTAAVMRVLATGGSIL